MQQANAHSQHLPALDLLRGAAIVAVVWHHMYIDAYPSGWWTGSKFGPFGTFASNGWLGVNLFFILSGFVLYWPIATGKAGLRTKQEWLAFYKRRALRLLPLFYVSVFVVIGLSSKADLQTQIALVTLTFNFHRNTFFPDPNWVLWSLGIEILFSVVFPFIAIAITRLGWRTTAFIVFILAVGARLVAAFTPGLAFNDPFLHPIKDSLVGRLDDFFVGMGLAAAYANGFTVRRPRFAIAAGILVWFFASMMVDAKVTGWLPIFLEPLIYSVVQLGTVAVVIGAICLPHLRIYPLELLGMMCYSIYIWHLLVMWHVSPPPHTIANTVKFFLVLAPLSWLSYRYIEFGHVKDALKLLPRRSHNSLQIKAP